MVGDYGNKVILRTRKRRAGELNVAMDWRAGKFTTRSFESQTHIF